MKPRLALVLFVCGVLGSVPLPGAAQTASPSPGPSAVVSPAPSSRPSHARTKDAATRVHRAIVDCDGAPFYNWPAPDVAPWPSSYPAARMGEAFGVIGDAHVSFNGQILYETTIDVVQPWGTGTHYWIAAACVNAA